VHTVAGHELRLGSEAGGSCNLNPLIDDGGGLFARSLLGLGCDSGIQCRERDPRPVDCWRARLRSCVDVDDHRAPAEELAGRGDRVLGVAGAVIGE
jgi:hypothetical protein